MSLGEEQQFRDNLNKRENKTGEGGHHFDCGVCGRTDIAKERSVFMVSQPSDHNKKPSGVFFFKKSVEKAAPDDGRSYGALVLTKLIE